MSIEPTYTPLTDPQSAALLLDWAKSFVISSTRRMEALQVESTDLWNAFARAEAIETHERSQGRDDWGGGWSVSARQQYDIDAAKLDARRQELVTSHKNNLAMVAFIERLLVDLAPREKMDADSSELIQWKATKAASTHSAGLLAADADCWPHVEGIWKDGWIKGYLTRKAEDRRAATGATS